jgi:group I intron endonuclease
MLIYKIVNNLTDDFYIGKTIKTKEERLQRHFYNSSYGSETHLHRAIRKYGENHFTIEEVECLLSEDTLNEREKYWIKKLNPSYNMTAGGDGGYTHLSPNYIRAMKEHHKNRPRETYASYGMLGKKMPEEAKKKIVKANSYPVKIDDVVYESIKEAKDKLGVTEKTVRYRIDSNNYPDWNRLRPKRSCPHQGSRAM